MVDSTKPLSDYILASLSGLSNAHPLALHVLSSSPKRTSALFPYAVNPPKCFEKEYLIVVSSHLPVADIPGSSGAANGQSSSLSTDATVSTPPRATNGNGNGNGNTPSSSDGPKEGRSVMVAALHAYVYTIPSSSTSIVYISKLDSSGHLPSPLPIARTLATSFITYHLLPSTRSARVQVRLFARSQGQYLFPNSAKVGGKRVSGGLVLCGWWKGVYEGCARLLREATGKTENADGCERGDGLKLRYLLPSYSAAEARGMLGAPKIPLPAGVEWTYGPPFVKPIFSSHGKTQDSNLTTGATLEGKDTNLAWSIPSLPDDPATRFLDELVLEASTAIPKKKETPKTHSATEASTEEVRKNRQQKEKERDEAERSRAQQFLGNVSDDEFWERMGFRQECISGDVTGFFALDIDTIPSRSTSPAQSSTSANETPAKTDLPLAIVDRIHKALLNCDFGTLDLAVDGTAIWLKSAKAIATDEIGEQGWEACTGLVPAKTGLSLGGEKRKEEAVTMLQPRKKKRTDAPAPTPAVNVLQPRKREKQ